MLTFYAKDGGFEYYSERHKHVAFVTLLGIRYFDRYTREMALETGTPVGPDLIQCIGTRVHEGMIEL